MYSDRRVIPLLQEIWVAEANGDVRFSLEAPKLYSKKYSKNSLILLTNRHNLAPL